MSQISEKLAELGITLPAAAAPAAAYIPVSVSGNTLTVSGQLPFRDGSFTHAVGKVGIDFTIEQGQEFAKDCAINILAQINTSLGGLENARCIKIGVFVNGDANFTDQPLVANGASNLIAEVLGENGKHARSAVGVASLPFGVAVEIDAIFEKI